jgi:hypothetical protein
MKKFDKWLAKRDKSLYEVLGPAGANYSAPQQPAMQQPQQQQPVQQPKASGFNSALANWKAQNNFNQSNKPAMQTQQQPQQQQGFTGWKDRKYYKNGELANGWQELKGENLEKSPYALGSIIKGTAGERKRTSDRYFQNGIEQNDQGKHVDSPVAGQASQEGFTGWKDRKYYKTGELADGGIYLKPGEENQTTYAIKSNIPKFPHYTRFRNGVEQEWSPSSEFAGLLVPQDRRPGLDDMIR